MLKVIIRAAYLRTHLSHLVAACVTLAPGRWHGTALQISQRRVLTAFIEELPQPPSNHLICHCATRALMRQLVFRKGSPFL